MAEIGFYHLTASDLERALPRLLEKALSSGARVVLRASSDARLEALDRHLWTYRPDSFLPHGRREDGRERAQPLFLTTLDENPNAASIGVIVDGAPFFERAAFERVLFLFDGADGEAVADARARWRAARDAGAALVYWRQTDRGAWKKAQEARAPESAREDG